MQSLYFPSNNSLRHLQSLVQGFWIEEDQDGVPVILFKVEASVTASIIGGCSIDVVIRNPKIESRSVTVYINDSKDNCMYLSGREFSKPNEVYNDFDEVVIKVATHSKIWLVLYNELTMPIFNALLSTTADESVFEHWVNQVHNNLEYRNISKSIDGYYYPENNYTGFIVTIDNTDHTEVDKTTVISYSHDSNNSELNGEAYNFNDYIYNGRHGYNQELSIKYFLSRFFEFSEEVFISPLNVDGTEFTDFVILLEDSALLIESKYVLSDKKTNMTKALTKAVNQLNNAHEKILRKKLSLKEKGLEMMLSSKKCCFRICLYNDRLILTERACQNLIKTFTKAELPFFISVSTFYQMIGLVKQKDSLFFKENLEYNLEKIYNEYLSLPDKLLDIRRLRVKEDSW